MYNQLSILYKKYHDQMLFHFLTIRLTSKTCTTSALAWEASVSRRYYSEYSMSFRVLTARELGRAQTYIALAPIRIMKRKIATSVTRCNVTAFAESHDPRNELRKRKNCTIVCSTRPRLWFSQLRQLMQNPRNPGSRCGGSCFESCLDISRSMRPL